MKVLKYFGFGVFIAGILMMLAIVLAKHAHAQSPPTPTLPPVTSTSVNTGYQGVMMPAVTATIASSNTTSGAVYLKGFELSGVLLPATFTGASISFLASVDGTTYVPLKSTIYGTLLTYIVTQNTFAAINPNDFSGVNYLKIVSASTEGSSRTLKLALRGR